MKAGDLMTPKVYSVTTTATAVEVAGQLLANQVSGFPVLDPEQNSIVGIVTEVDILKAVQSGLDLGSVTAAELMTPKVISVDIEASIEEIVELLERHGIRRLPVTDGTHLVGVVSRSDLIKHMLRSNQILAH